MVHQIEKDVNNRILPGHSACPGCAMMLAIKYTVEALEGDIMVAAPAGCITATHGHLPSTAYNFPIFDVAFASAASIATGMQAGLKRKGGNVTVIAMAGDGGTGDIGLQALSGAAERGDNIVYLCNDNEAYMNTGAQRSSMTPYGVRTSTTPIGKKRTFKKEEKKNLPFILASSAARYVATTTIAYPSDFKQKIEKARDVEGVGYVQSLNPCPPGWGFEPEKTVELSRLAVETGVWKLYEIEDGKVFQWNKKPKKRKPIKEYLNYQKRFRHLGTEEVNRIQNMVDNEWEFFRKIERCFSKVIREGE